MQLLLLLIDHYVNDKFKIKIKLFQHKQLIVQ